MKPVSTTRFSETSAAGRAALAQGMVFGILPHPESKHHTRLRIVRRAWNEQEKPHVRGLAVCIGRCTGFPTDLACFLDGKCERPLFPFFRFQLPDRVAQGI